MKTLAIICSLLLAPCAFAQQYSVAWAKIGAVSSTSGSSYILNSTIGQTAASVANSDNYVLGNGYWGILAGTQWSGVSTLVITAAGRLLNGGFGLEFNGNVDETYTLEASTDLKNWVTVLPFTCTNSPMFVADPWAGSHPTRFYRVTQ